MRHHLLPLFRTTATFATCLFLVTGCSAPLMLLGYFEPPVVTLQVSRVDSVSPTTLVVDVVLSVDNPNAFALAARTVRYRLRVADQVLAAGTGASRGTIPPHATGTVDVRLQLPFPVLSAAAPAALMLGEIPYDLDGTLVVGSALASREVPFAVSGVMRINVPLEAVRLPRLPSLVATGTS